MTSNELLERIHLIGQIECSDPDCSACAEHRKDALLEIEKYRESVLGGATRAFIKLAVLYLQEDGKYKYDPIPGGRFVEAIREFKEYL